MDNSSWIHNFAITETSRHKKGHTIYKIISIIFPRTIPEALSTITVWKRFKDVKELHKLIFRKHKEKHLKGQVPEIKYDNFFKRHDPDVIKARKENILQLLYFISENPALYQSQAFFNFFERNSSPADSPLKSPSGNIAKICSDINISVEANIPLIDPHKDETDTASQNDSLISFVISSATSDTCSVVLEESTILEKSNLDGQSVSSEHHAKPVSMQSLSLLERTESIDYTDYLYEAAYEFSSAVLAETNSKFKEAFDLYKNGIDKLLYGVKSDKDDSRRKIVKSKISKYLEHAEEIFEKHILNCRDDLFSNLELGSGLTLDNSEVKNLERPLNYLARYKVVNIVSAGLMQVLDVTTKICYIMKPIEKSTNHTIFLPQDILYMSPLIHYFQSDTTIYLLIKMASGGNLWSYIHWYANKSTTLLKKHTSIESMFVEPQALATETTITDGSKEKSTRKCTKRSEISSSSSSPNSNEGGYDSGFVEHECKPNSRSKAALFKSYSPINENAGFTPSFDTLSCDMDANDLVACSKKLLNSVANTLHVLRTEENPADEKVMTSTDLDLSKVPEFRIILKQNAENSQNYDEILKLNNELTTRLTQTLTDPVISDGQCANRCDLSCLDGSIKQWARELIVAIQSLHSHSIICGDLSMNNLLLGSNGGQLLLTYFYRRDKNNEEIQESLNKWALRRWYVAAERPLTFASDWWSLGVILFELFTKKSYISCHPCGPFYYYEVQYPEYLETELAEDVKELIEGLLQINPENRFGLADIMNHRTFQGTNWADVKAMGKSNN